MDVTERVLAIAMKIARSESRKYPGLDSAELLGAAWEGAQGAADRWDESKANGGQWEVFVATQAKFRIKDYLRQCMPAGTRRNNKQKVECMPVSLESLCVRDDGEHEYHSDMFGEDDQSYREIETSEFLDTLAEPGRTIFCQRLRGVTLKQIGKQIGLSESRVSQVVSELSSLFAQQTRFRDLRESAGRPARTDRATERSR